MLADIHERLAGVVVEQLPYPDLIRRYYGTCVLFYIDPPYVGCETDYGAGVFAPEDFKRMAEQLAGFRWPVHPVDQRPPDRPRGVQPLLNRGG